MGFSGLTSGIRAIEVFQRLGFDITRRREEVLHSVGVDCSSKVTVIRRLIGKWRHRRRWSKIVNHDDDRRSKSGGGYEKTVNGGDMIRRR
ncbi:hypothetical protein HanRHA438_Chr01g0005831 [Helianthus annuus]|nr:hypothetical protein HanRHA438_Chr01g0005831 [Helianthus annuus]